MKELQTNFQKIQARFLETTSGMAIEEGLWSTFNPLSSNKVTGESVNFPVSGTCQPSKVCAQTCYALKGPIVWPASFTKQNQNLLLCKADPIRFGQLVANKCRRKLMRDKSFYLRWNGVGDLFEEAVEAVLEINRQLPDLPIWLVTRKAIHVHELLGKKNIWVHFSLDKSSMKRRPSADSDSWVNAPNVFFSYQGDKNEELLSLPNDISVLFFDGYKLAGNESFKNHEAICPLNIVEDITGICNSCRRCFSGEAVAIRPSVNRINRSIETGVDSKNV